MTDTSALMTKVSHRVLLTITPARIIDQKKSTENYTLNMRRTEILELFRKQGLTGLDIYILATYAKVNEVLAAYEEIIPRDSILGSIMNFNAIVLMINTAQDLIRETVCAWNVVPDLPATGEIKHG